VIHGNIKGCFDAIDHHVPMERVAEAPLVVVGVIVGIGDIFENKSSNDPMLA
jgi:hypothetical protein